MMATLKSVYTKPGVATDDREGLDSCSVFDSFASYATMTCDEVDANGCI